MKSFLLAAAALVAPALVATSVLVMAAAPFAAATTRDVAVADVATPRNLIWAGTAENNTWDEQTSLTWKDTSIYTLGPPQETFAAGDSVVFAEAASSYTDLADISGTVALSGVVRPHDVAVRNSIRISPFTGAFYNSSTTFFFDGSNGNISATGDLTKSGTGKLEISGAHIFDGNANIEGTLHLRGGASLVVAGAFTAARAAETQNGTAIEFPDAPSLGALAATGTGNRIKAASIALPFDVVLAFDLTGTAPSSAPLLTLDSTHLTGLAVGAGYVEVSGFDYSVSGDYALAHVTSGAVATTGTLLVPYEYRENYAFVGNEFVGSFNGTIVVGFAVREGEPIAITRLAPLRSNTDGSATNTYLALKKSADAQTLLLSVNHAAADTHSTDLTWTGATDAIWRDAEYSPPRQSNTGLVFPPVGLPSPLPNWAGTVSGDNGPAAVNTFLNGDDVTFTDPIAPDVVAPREVRIAVTGPVAPRHILVENSSGTRHTFAGNGAIVATGRLTKRGTGVLALTGAQTFAAGAHIEAGVLQIGTTTPADTNFGAETLAVTGDITLYAGTALAIDLFGGNIGDRLEITGSLLASDNLRTTTAATAATTASPTTAPTAAVNILLNDAAPVGTYVLITATADLALTLAADAASLFTTSGLDASLTAAFSYANANRALVLTLALADGITPPPARDRARTWAAGDGIWDAATANWKDTTGAPATFAARDAVRFSAAAGETKTITLAATALVSDMTVFGDGDIAISGASIHANPDAAQLQSTGGLLKNGAGTLHLGDTDEAVEHYRVGDTPANALSFSGGVAVNSGTLVVFHSKLTSPETVILAGAKMRLRNATLDGGYLVNNGVFTANLNNYYWQQDVTASKLTLDALVNNGVFTLENNTDTRTQTLANTGVFTMGDPPFEPYWPDEYTWLENNSTLYVTIPHPRPYIPVEAPVLAVAQTLTNDGTLALGHGKVAIGELTNNAALAITTQVKLATLTNTRSGTFVLGYGGDVGDVGTDPPAPFAGANAARIVNHGLMLANGIVRGHLVNTGTLAPENDAGTPKVLSIDGQFTNTGVIRIRYSETHWRNSIIRNIGAENIVIGGTLLLDVSDITAAWLAERDNILPRFLHSVGTSTDADGTLTAVGSIALADDIVLAFSNPALSGEILDPATGEMRLFAARDSITDSAGRLYSGSLLRGFGALTALPLGNASDSTAALHAHLDSGHVGQDRKRLLKPEISTYFFGTGTFARNGTGHAAPAFDTDSYGGAVGVDYIPADSTLLFGVNLGGHAARATLHGDGGRIRQENFRATAYASALPTPLTFIDAAIYGGFSDYTVNRHQASPLQPAARATANADTTGFDAGASLRAGLFLPLGLFMFTPHVGLEYTHAEVDAFTENAKHRTGADLAEDFTADALHLSRLNQDSLRAQIGGALSCQASLISHVGVRLSLNFSYARELLDTKTKIHARFADNANNAGGGAPAFFDTRVVSTAQDIVQVGPSLEFAFSPNTTLTIGYTYGSDLRDQTANRIHAAFHLRF